MDCMIDVDIELKDSIHIKEYIDSAGMKHRLMK